MHFSTTTILVAATACLAQAKPEATPAPQLIARSADPVVIGYFSGTNGYNNLRTCDYPQTVSTSGSFAQCCAPTGGCNFYTACSSNTLMGGSTSVPCDNVGVCNTAVLLPTVGAMSGASNLGCWQASLGSSAFSLVQDIGSATVAPATTSGSSAARSTGASTTGASRSAQSSSNGASSASSAAPTTSNAAAGGFGGILTGGGAIVAALAVAQAML